MKAQRLKITEPGMTTYSDYYCGIKFTDGLSDEAIAPAIMYQIGSYIRVEAVDDGEQIGEGTRIEKLKVVKAEVKEALTKITPATSSPETVSTKSGTDRHTKESLEKIADDFGIGGLRNIADQYGVKGRGIVELINEILRAQG